MDKVLAKKVQSRMLNIITEFSKTLIDLDGQCDPEEYKSLKRAIGINIGEIQVEILDRIYNHYPDLDDLR